MGGSGTPKSETGDPESYGKACKVKLAPPMASKELEPSALDAYPGTRDICQSSGGTRGFLFRSCLWREMRARLASGGAENGTTNLVKQLMTDHFYIFYKSGKEEGERRQNVFAPGEEMWSEINPTTQ